MHLNYELDDPLGGPILTQCARVHWRDNNNKKNEGVESNRMDGWIGIHPQLLQGKLTNL